MADMHEEGIVALTVLSSEGRAVVLPPCVVSRCLTLSNMLSDVAAMWKRASEPAVTEGADEGSTSDLRLLHACDDEDPIQLDISEAVLHTIAAWCQLDAEGHIALHESGTCMGLSTQERPLFTRLSGEDLMQTLTASNFLECTPLMNACAFVLAARLGSEQTGGVEGLLDVTTPFTDDEVRDCFELYPFLMETCHDMPEYARIRDSMNPT
eukprot:m.358314 g.358314  ORF g.358314 m.358314 type:complete len:210 (-) comp18113_c0_seq1:174-803(-)